MKCLKPEQVLEVIPDEMLLGRGMIPSDLDLFEDHFPDFPVLPGVLSLEILKCGIEACLGITGKRLKLIKTGNVRFQHFLRPGETWECQVTRISLSADGQSTWTGTLRVQEKRAVMAQLVVEQAV